MMDFSGPQRVFVEGVVNDSSLEIRTACGSVEAVSFPDVRERGHLMLQRAFSLSQAASRGLVYNAVKRGMVAVEQVLPCGRRIHIFDEAEDVLWDVPEFTFRFSQSLRTEMNVDSSSTASGECSSDETLNSQNHLAAEPLFPLQPINVDSIPFNSRDLDQSCSDLGISAKQKYDIRSILLGKPYGMPRLLEKYDNCVEGLNVPDFNKIKGCLAVYLLAECEKKDQPNRQREVKPFCEAIVKAFPKQGYTLAYFFNDSYSGKFEYALKNQKQKPGHHRSVYETVTTRRKKLVFQLSADERASTEQKLIALRSVVPAPETIGQIRTLHVETTKYRRNFLKDSRNAQVALTTFPRLADTPELLLLDFQEEHGVTQVEVEHFLAKWDSDWVPKILITAIVKHPSAIIVYRSDPAFDSLAKAKDHGDIDPDLRSEAALKVLPFLLPGGSAIKKVRVKDAVRKIMLEFQDCSFDEVINRIQKRAERLRICGDVMSPVLVKFCRGSAKSYYVALDGKLLETHGNLTMAIVVLLATFATFWCRYPVALRPLYRCLEYAMGVNGGLGMTPSLEERIQRIKSAEKIVVRAEDLNDNSL